MNGHSFFGGDGEFDGKSFMMLGNSNLRVFNFHIGGVWEAVDVFVHKCSHAPYQIDVENFLIKKPTQQGISRASTACRIIRSAHAFGIHVYYACSEHCLKCKLNECIFKLRCRCIYSTTLWFMVRWTAHSGLHYRTERIFACNTVCCKTIYAVWHNCANGFRVSTQHNDVKNQYWHVRENFIEACMADDATINIHLIII